jgi:hypothetical protein
MLRVTVVSFLLMTFMVAAVSAQQPDVTVSSVELPNLNWGRQQGAFEVTNHTDYWKFITVVTDIRFSESYLTPERTAKTHFILDGQVTSLLTPILDIPGNYGRADIRVRIYDVVDTLDAFEAGELLVEQDFVITFHVPEAMTSYLQNKITLPPMVEEHPDFDNEFARLLLILIHEGKSLEQVAEMTKAEQKFVDQTADNLARKGYLSKQDETWNCAVTVITLEEAQAAKVLSEGLSDQLAGMIAGKMDAYWSTVDSLAVAGTISADTNDFLSGGNALYRPYPIISSLVLWYDLGQKFVTRSAPFMIYNGTDLCKAYIPFYMYAVQGGDVYNGHHFYDFKIEDVFTIVFADTPPEVVCKEDWEKKRRMRERVDWNYAAAFTPESFAIDTNSIRPALDVLARGADSLLAKTYYELKDLAKQHGHSEGTSIGYRYWFWNLTATRTLRKLIDQGTLSRRGNGIFKFENLEFNWKQ